MAEILAFEIVERGYSKYPQQAPDVSNISPTAFNTRLCDTNNPYPIHSFLDPHTGIPVWDSYDCTHTLQIFFVVGFLGYTPDIEYDGTQFGWHWVESWTFVPGSTSVYTDASYDFLRFVDIGAPQHIDGQVYDGTHPWWSGVQQLLVKCSAFQFDEVYGDQVHPSEITAMVHEIFSLFCLGVNVPFPTLSMTTDAATLVMAGNDIKSQGRSQIQARWDGPLLVDLNFEVGCFDTGAMPAGKRVLFAFGNTDGLTYDPLYVKQMNTPLTSQPLVLPCTVRSYGASIWNLALTRTNSNFARPVVGDVWRDSKCVCNRQDFLGLAPVGVAKEVKDALLPLRWRPPNDAGKQVVSVVKVPKTKALAPTFAATDAHCTITPDGLGQKFVTAGGTARVVSNLMAQIIMGPQRYVAVDYVNRGAAVTLDLVFDNPNVYNPATVLTGKHFPIKLAAGSGTFFIDTLRPLTVDGGAVNYSHRNQAYPIPKTIPADYGDYKVALPFGIQPMTEMQISIPTGNDFTLSNWRLSGKDTVELNFSSWGSYGMVDSRDAFRIAHTIEEPGIVNQYPSDKSMIDGLVATQNVTKVSESWTFFGIHNWTWFASQTGSGPQASYDGSGALGNIGTFSSFGTRLAPLTLFDTNFNVQGSLTGSGLKLFPGVQNSSTYGISPVNIHATLLYGSRIEGTRLPAVSPDTVDITGHAAYNLNMSALEWKGGSVPLPDLACQASTFGFLDKPVSYALLEDPWFAGLGQQVAWAGWCELFPSPPPPAAMGPRNMVDIYGRLHRVNANAMGDVEYHRSDSATPPFAVETTVVAGAGASLADVEAYPIGDLVHVVYDKSPNGVYEKFSSDDGQTWWDEALVIAGGTHPVAALSDDLQVVAAYVSGQIHAVVRDIGDPAIPAATAFKDSSLTPLSVADDSFGLSFAAEAPGRCVLSVVILGDTEITEWFSTDRLETWTKVT